MAAVDVLGAVADRLVEGMMFHSDHADLCRLMGFKRLTKLHERGFRDDSKALRAVHQLCIERTGMVVAQGRQERTRTLDQWKGVRMRGIADEKRVEMLKVVMNDWLDWEDGTADTYRTAARRLWEVGETALSAKVNELAEDTEEELAGATDLMCRLSASNWDATIA